MLVIFEIVFNTEINTENKNHLNIDFEEVMKIIDKMCYKVMDNRDLR